ncbi:MAG TPA: helix-turn-helix transcriptional regulator [Fimbriimonas sp.]|nr:helix-turn-helix transcriptional regulator [Fimbriimonas sp.]
MSHLEQKKKIAERCKEARRLSGLSQGQVAELMGWKHRPIVSQIEAGDRTLSATEAADLAKLFDVRLEWLLAAEGEAEDMNTARAKLAARELEKLKPEELERLLQILASMRRED